MMGLFTRAIRPADSSGEIPNGNDPVTAAPGTVGPPSAVPGDPSGVVITGDDPPWTPLPRVLPSAWSGWPDGWQATWGSGIMRLTDIAWACVDLNASLLSTMPPYLVNAAPTLDAGWMTNPDPDVYTSWEEFAKQLFTDFQMGEAFVLATSRYSTGWPARFHVVAPWYVEITLQQGLRRYAIGGEDVTDDMLHLRYSSRVGYLHGQGPLDAGAARVVAAQTLMNYASSLVANGGVPTSVLEHPDELTPAQAQTLKAEWVQARISGIGEPAVLSGGITWKPVQLNAQDMALVELAQFNESRIAVMLGVPPHLVGLSSGPDSMTYKNVQSIFDYHWRAGLRPKAQTVMSGLSGWLLPRGTSVEVNRDAYTQPAPLERAQTAQILNSIVDKNGNPAMTVEEIRDRERLDDSTTPQDLSEGILK